ncbi:hypothetical protein ACJIZ3_023425 [Penstemon smallii]|uniref:Uncharacterized protein n=1 Tax=Penstemon smallii TaxID=265156 RepID=A0ABD3TP21_9LAMI
MDQSFSYEVLGAQATGRLVVSFNMAGYNGGFYISILSRSRRIEPNHCKFGWNSAANGPVLFLRGYKGTLVWGTHKLWYSIVQQLRIFYHKNYPLIWQVTTEASISPFYQGHGESNQITANLVGTQRPMDQSFSYEVLGAQATGRLVVSFNRPMDQSFSYEVLGAQATGRLVVSFNMAGYNGGFYISILSRSRRIEPNHCKFGWNSAANGPVLFLRGYKGTLVWGTHKLWIDCPTIAYFLPQKLPPYVVEQG